MSGWDFFAVDSHRQSSPSSVVAVVGRRRRRSSPSSVVAVVRHFHFFVQGRDLWKKSNFRCFSKKLTIFLKSKIFSKMSGRDFIAVDRRRRSSPSSVVAVIRHFHFFVQGRELWKKSNFRCFSKKLTIFLKSKIFSKMSGRDFIAVDGRRRSSSVVAVVKSVVAVIRHFHFFVQGRDLWKKSDFRCFSKKITIFLKSKIFSKMSGRDFIAVDRRRRSSPSSVVAVIRHFHFFVQGRDLWKKSDFRCFSKKLAIFLKSKIFSKMSGRDFFAADSHRRSSPSSVVAVIGRRRRPSLPFFVQGRDLWKKSDFRCFSKKITIFLKSKIFSKMSGRDFFAVDGRRRSSPSSVVAVVGRRRHPSFPLFRPRKGPLKKIRFSLFFKKTRNFSEIQDF